MAGFVSLLKDVDWSAWGNNFQKIFNPPSQPVAPKSKNAGDEAHRKFTTAIGNRFIRERELDTYEPDVFSNQKIKQVSKHPLLQGYFERTFTVATYFSRQLALVSQKENPLLRALGEQNINQVSSLLFQGVDPNQKVVVENSTRRGVRYTKEYSIFTLLVTLRLPRDLYVDARSYCSPDEQLSKDEIATAHDIAYRVQLLARHLICAGVTISEDDLNGVKAHHIYMLSLSTSFRGKNIRMLSGGHVARLSDEMRKFNSSFVDVFADAFACGSDRSLDDLDLALFSTRLFYELKAFEKKVNKRRQELMQEFNKEILLYPQKPRGLIAEYWNGGYIEKMAHLEKEKSLSLVTPPESAEDLS